MLQVTLMHACLQVLSDPAPRNMRHPTMAARLLLILACSSLAMTVRGHGYLSNPKPRSLVSYERNEGLTYWYVHPASAFHSLDIIMHAQRLMCTCSCPVPA